MDSYFCAWPYWIWICRSFSFRRKSYGRRVFKWITQRVSLTFALVKFLAFAPLFNARKKHVLNYFALEMAAIIVARRSGFFSTRINLFWMPEENIIRTYRLPSHVIFNLLQENIRWLWIPGLSKLLANLHFWPLVLFNVLWLLYFFILYLQLR